MMNKVIMIGHITRKIELHYLQSGIAVGNTTLVTNKNYKKPDGSKAQITCFIDIIFYGRLAEIANEYLHKGSKVSIEGRLNMAQWSDQHGNKRIKHDIIIESLEMLDNKDKHANNSNNTTQNTSQFSYSNENNNKNNTNLKKIYNTAPSVNLDMIENQTINNSNTNDTHSHSLYDNNEIPF